MRAEAAGLVARVGRGGAPVGVDQVAGLDALEPVACEPCGVLCFQQSSCNSTGPEIDVASPFLAHRTLDRDVGKLHSAAGAQHAVELREDGILIRHEVDHAVRDDDVERRVLERQQLDLPLDETHVRDVEFSGCALARSSIAGVMSIPVTEPSAPTI